MGKDVELSRAGLLENEAESWRGELGMGMSSPLRSRTGRKLPDIVQYSSWVASSQK